MITSAPLQASTDKHYERLLFSSAQAQAQPRALCSVPLLPVEATRPCSPPAASEQHFVQLPCFPLVVDLPLFSRRIMDGMEHLTRSSTSRSTRVRVVLSGLGPVRQLYNECIYA
jgi:hypothetical protein